MLNNWYDFGDQAGDADLFTEVVAHIACAAVPPAVLQYLRSGQVTPLATPTGGHRAPRGVFPSTSSPQSSHDSPKKGSVVTCAGPLQHEVGCPDGANKMIKTIKYIAEADPARVLVALDRKADFDNV